MKRGKRDLPRLINCLSDRGSPNLLTHVLLWQCKVAKEQSLRNATSTYVRVHDLCVFIGRCRLRGHSFSTYAQISRFQTHPPTVYAQIRTSLWQQYIGIRKALDPLPSSGVYVLNEWPLNVPHIKHVDITVQGHY